MVNKDEYNNWWCVSTFVSLCVYRFGQISRHQFASMSHAPPSYSPPRDDSKGLYPSVPHDQPQPGGYYPPQQPPVAPSAPQQTAVTYYPPTGPQQQQQPQQLVVTQTPVTVAQTQPVQSYVGHIILSCVVTWCCCCPCGLIAFILASKCNSFVYQFDNRH